MKRRNNKTYILTGYRAQGVSLYNTKLKPLGRIVAGLGFACLGVAIFPNGLGVVFYPLGFALLGLVGIKLNIKAKVSDKIRMIKYKRGWL